MDGALKNEALTLIEKRLRFYFVNLGNFGNIYESFL